MKLKFKQQQYQHDAAMTAVRCFQGQSKGVRKEIVGRTIDPHALRGMEVSIDEIFSNKKLDLTAEQFLIFSLTELRSLPNRTLLHLLSLK